MAGFLEGLEDFTFGGARRRDQRQELNNEISLLRATTDPRQRAEIVARIQQGPAFKEFMQREIPKIKVARTAKDLNAAANALKNIDAAEESRSLLPEGEDSDEWKRTYQSLRDAILAPLELGGDNVTEPTQPGAEKPGTGKPGTNVYIKGKKVGTVNAAGNAEYFEEGSEFVGPPAPRAYTPQEIIEQAERNADFFQVSTPELPKEDLPKTYDDVGVDSPQDIQTLQEIQKLVPDNDMKDEYRQNPEGMKKLLEAWRQGKLNKQQLRNAFSSLQQTAQEALGIA
jgi:hypothetical protein